MQQKSAVGLLIAHVRSSDQNPQTLQDHLFGVSKLAEHFTASIDLPEIGTLLGLAHDLGKASHSFQNYLRTETGFLDPDFDGTCGEQGEKGKIDHSTAGAQIVYQNLIKFGHEGKLAAQALSLCLASHHSGLIDCLKPDGEDNFSRRMDKSEDLAHTTETLTTIDAKVLEELQSILNNENWIKKFTQVIKEIKELNDDKETYFIKIGLFIRFLYSCLIDADRLDAADFEFPINLWLRNYGEYQSWSCLVMRLEDALQDMQRNKTEEIIPEYFPVNDVRDQVSQACKEFSNKPKGIYQLTVPTGGGKTLSSLRFALNHAGKHGMDRVFYIIPYTSIIDQNAEIIRSILEEKDKKGNYLNQIVLEHHSNLTPDEESYRQSLLSQNWDAPVVLTTQVQFLEALFGSGTSSPRRMHQLANSVLIFDEVQTIPVRCVHLFNLALRFLVKTCGCTVVLCTATQPLLDNIDPPTRSLIISEDQKIIKNDSDLFQKLKRVEVIDNRKVEGWQTQEIAELIVGELHEYSSVLTIVNTRKTARALYQEVNNKKLTDVFHLSTNMCPAHRLDTLASVRKKLDNKELVICISTQLIEAGVDIDFGSVIRYLAGLDSITQAAGRCNRNGRNPSARVWVVNPAEENLDRLVDIRIGREKTLRIFDEFNQNPVSFKQDRIGLEAIRRFYQYYFYDRKEEMNYPVSKNSPVGVDDNLFNLLSLNSQSVSQFSITHQNNLPTIPFRQSFQSAARAFSVIDSHTHGVVVPYGTEGRDLITQLCGNLDGHSLRKVLKKAQRYSVNLFSYDFEYLGRIQAIKEVKKDAGIFYLDEQYYSAKFGWCEDTVNDMEMLIH